jgi:uncharacterized protein YjbJ (UPF0337 family)
MDKDRIAGTTKEFAGKAEGTIGELAGDAGTQAAGRVREAAGTAQNLYGQAKDQIKDAARDAADTAGTYARQAYDGSGDAFRQGSDALARRIRDNPLGSVLVAGGIGFALALMMLRPAPRPRRGWRYYS